MLFGPPGTGKTMLAKAAAGMNSNEITFFNVSSATIVNKWRGESEKIVRTLFTLARSSKFAPSIVFLDEIDAVASSRGSRSEHEADRRLKSVLFSQIDGIVGGHHDRGGESKNKRLNSVMILATTNRPWDIDEAMRRRLEKRIYVGLPDEPTREAMLKLHLGASDDQTQADQQRRNASEKNASTPYSDDLDLKHVATATEGYSGADIRLLCREAAMMPMRRLLEGKSTQDVLELRRTGALEKLGQITNVDFEAALARTKPSVAHSEETLGRYKRWEDQYGSK